MSYDPNQILADVWRRLHAGRADGRHAFRTAALATADALGRPDVRTVVLRRVDEVARCLDFQTDRRSPKAFGLQHNGAAAWLFYDRVEQLQLRVHTTVTLHTHDPVADAEWAAVPAKARAPYAGTLAPGAEAGANATDAAAGGDGRKNFAVARCRIESLEWLKLQDQTWHRLRFAWTGDTAAWQWLVP